MGYEDGSVKRERKESDIGARRDNDEDEDDEEDNKIMDENATRRQNGHQNRPSQNSYARAGTELKRTGSRQQGYFHQSPSGPIRQNTAGSGKERSSNVVDYRDSAVFSDEAQSPVGTLIQKIVRTQY